MAKETKEYRDKLFAAASLVLPSVVIRADIGATESELVDQAVSLARSLLAELNCVPTRSKS